MFLFLSLCPSQQCFSHVETGKWKCLAQGHNTVTPPARNTFHQMSHCAPKKSTSIGFSKRTGFAAAHTIVLLIVIGCCLAWLLFRVYNDISFFSKYRGQFSRVSSKPIQGVYTTTPPSFSSQAYHFQTIFDDTLTIRTSGRDWTYIEP